MPNLDSDFANNERNQAVTRARGVLSTTTVVTGRDVSGRFGFADVCREGDAGGLMKRRLTVCAKRNVPQQRHNRDPALLQVFCDSPFSQSKKPNTASLNAPMPVSYTAVIPWP
jgi:hypothetical protein